MNLYPAFSLIRHRFLSTGTGGHGIHSPFIYDFLTSVVRGDIPCNIITRVEGLRQEMMTDERIISVTDLGAGSVRRAGSLRRISDIARHAALPLRHAGLLARMVQGAGRMIDGEGIILELGTSLGISTLAMALAAPGRRIVTVEGCPSQAEIARRNLKKHGALNAEVINMEFSMAITKLKEAKERVVFAFIDGDHRGKALSDYVLRIRAMGEEMIIVADDIRLSADMYSGWTELSSFDFVATTLETTRFGIIFIKEKLTPGRYRVWC